MTALLHGALNKPQGLRASGERCGEPPAVADIDGARDALRIGEGGGHGGSEFRDGIVGEAGGPLLVAGAGEFLDDLDGDPGDLDEPADGQHRTGQQGHLLGLLDRGHRRQVPSGVSEDDGDARTGQPGSGDDQVSAGGGDALRHHDTGRGALRARDAAEGDGAGRWEPAHALDGAFEAFLGSRLLGCRHAFLLPGGGLPPMIPHQTRTGGHAGGVPAAVRLALPAPWEDGSTRHRNPHRQDPGSQKRPNSGPMREPPRITTREREVLGLVGSGPNDAGTEREPVILHGTLKSRIARLLTTLGMRDRPQHATIAHEAGASPTGPDPTAQSPARLESHPRTATTTDTPAQSKGPASTTAPMNTNQKQQPRALKNRTSFTSLPTSHTQYHGS